MRDNIDRFGGDPGNVMIFGQSGGGWKVSLLMAMPAAQGLFHRAVVQSGSALQAALPEETGRLAAAVLDELGVTAGQLDKLHELPVESLVAAGQAAIRKTAQPIGVPFDMGAAMRHIGWSPTVDGAIIPRHPFDPTAPAISAGVPMLIGTVRNEFYMGVDNPEAGALTEEELTQRVGQMYGARSDATLAAYRRGNPGATPFELMALIAAEPVRQAAVTQAERKAALGAAPAYLYEFAWRTPVLEGSRARTTVATSRSCSTTSTATRPTPAARPRRGSWPRRSAKPGSTSPAAAIRTTPRCRTGRPTAPAAARP